MTAELMLVSVNHRTIDINKSVYTLLFDNSSVHSLAPYQRSLAESRISFAELSRLARKADIPYALFFGDLKMAESNLKRKNDILLGGVSKGTFSVNSRGNIELRDIELIVKDLLRKQSVIKKYTKHPDNPIVGKLKNSKLNLDKQADIARQLIGLDLNYLHKHGKITSFDYLVSIFEASGVYISQSSRTFMPQNIQNNIRFSGICIRDKKIPFIFLNSKDDTDSFEPAGRKIFTLILLFVCLLKGNFKPLTYNDQSSERIEDSHYLLAEEILLPSNSIGSAVLKDINDLKNRAQAHSVTPSAFLMRLRHMGIITDESASNYGDTLKAEFEARTKQSGGQPVPAAKGFKKYNGTACSKAIINLVDQTILSKGEARKILFQNKQKTSFLEDFRNIL